MFAIKNIDPNIPVIGAYRNSKFENKPITEQMKPVQATTNIHKSAHSALAISGRLKIRIRSKFVLRFLKLYKEIGNKNSNFTSVFHATVWFVMMRGRRG